MRAAVLYSYGDPLQIEERPVPVPTGEEVLVRVRAVGVCGTDVGIAAGREGFLPLPLVLGHEICGEAEGIGPVLVYGAWGCRECNICTRGDQQLCASSRPPGRLVDGGFADYVVVPSPTYLLPLQGIDSLLAPPLGDAALTAYHAVLRALPVLEHGGGTALVIGAGGLGQFAVQLLARLSSARIVVSETAPQRRERARQLGAHEAVDPARVTQPADAVIDFVGTDETLALATRRVTRGGLIEIVGSGNGTIHYSTWSMPLEAQVTSSIWGSRAELEQVLAMAVRGELAWRVTHMPLERASEALAMLADGRVTDRLVLVP